MLPGVHEMKSLVNAASGIAKKLEAEETIPLQAAPGKSCIPEGKRNTYLTSLAGSMRHRGMSSEAIEAALLQENQQCCPPLPESEIREIVKSISRYPAGDTQSDNAVVARLAALKPIEYDRVREKEADALKVRVTTLDREVAKKRGDGISEESGQGRPFEIPQIEPWPDPVDGAGLLDELACSFKRFVVMPGHGYSLAALWVLHTYVFDCWPVSPILAIVSPEKGCGKTTLRDVLAKLVRAPLPIDGISAAALFRVIEKWCPTVLMDDFDSWGRENEELRGVLNTGYRAGGFYVRCVGDDQEPRAFATFSPKSINLIGRLHPTLADRSITIELRRRLRDEVVESLHRFDGETLCRKCARWAADNREMLKTASPVLPDFLFNRVANNWEPLFAIAAAVGSSWPINVQTAAEAAVLSREDEEESFGVMLLADLRQLFKSHGERLSSTDIAENLAEMEERPWPEFHSGRPITVRQVARLLRPFGIKPKTIRTGANRTKGYLSEQFRDAFERYIPDPAESIRDKRDNPMLSGSYDTKRSVTNQGHVTDQIDNNHLNSLICHDVTDQDPPSEAAMEIVL